MKYNKFIIALLVWLAGSTLMFPAFAQDHDAHSHEEPARHSDHDEEHEEHDNHHDLKGEHGDDHEEGKTEIAPHSAQTAGIKIEKSAPAKIANTIPLTGRIILNENTKANVRARFAGIVRDVHINLGEKVEKGQLLATVESNESLQNYNVTAPISGIILERKTNIGDVAGDEPLFMIADLSEVWAKFHVFPKDANKVATGQIVRVQKLDENTQNNAKIEILFPTADSLSQTLVAIAPLANDKNIWRPGMTVEGNVIISEKQVPLAVRASALQTMEDQTVIFIKDGDKYEMRPVITGLSDGEYIEIISGLQSGQDYVSENSFIIKADILKSGAAHEH